jgi:hypothetical protein
LAAGFRVLAWEKAREEAEEVAAAIFAMGGLGWLRERKKRRLVVDW